MKKNRFFVVEKLVTILLLGVTVVGCTTTRYVVEISNVPRTNIRAVYIRNAGAAHWGNNIVGNLNNIDRTRYSETVDIRVVDINGVVYSRYNVPFNEASFVETGTTSTMSPWVWVGIAGALIGVAIVVGGEVGE